MSLILKSVIYPLAANDPKRLGDEQNEHLYRVLDEHKTKQPLFEHSIIVYMDETWRLCTKLPDNGS